MTPLRLLLAVTLSSLSAAVFAASPRAIKVGAFAADITPTSFPSPVATNSSSASSTRA